MKVFRPVLFTCFLPFLAQGPYFSVAVPDYLYNDHANSHEALIGEPLFR